MSRRSPLAAKVAAFEVEAKTVFGLARAMRPESIQATRQRMQRALQPGCFSHTAVFEQL